MPTRNNDASYLTQRLQARVLYGFNAARQAAVNAGTSVRPEQASQPTLDVITLRKQGGCFCANDTTNNVYAFQPPGGPWQQ